MTSDIAESLLECIASPCDTKYLLLEDRKLLFEYDVSRKIVHVIVSFREVGSGLPSIPAPEIQSIGGTFMSAW